jgi:hypothetical protein
MRQNIYVIRLNLACYDQIMIPEKLKKYKQWWPASFFLIGFLYDAWSLDRIDSLFGIIKHGLYLSGIATFLALEILHTSGKFTPRARFAKAWEYHELAVHFLLGSLLSEYTLFFFKSASLWSSLFFLILLGAILVLNEFKQFKGASGIPVRVALFSICLVSYLVYLVPVLQGYVGTVPFLLAIFCACVVMFIFTKIIKNKLDEDENNANLKKRLIVPFAWVVGAMVGLYFMHLIPPIPVAVRYLGVFHEITKQDGKYNLGYTRSRWKFWQNGDQTFLAREGDKIHCFVRVFSPGRFSDQVQIRWLFDDPKRGWQLADVIPIAITGGRDEGYRGITFKSNYQFGDWQIRVETTDGRELGRIYFTVVADASTLDRQVHYESQ